MANIRLFTPPNFRGVLTTPSGVMLSVVPDSAVVVSDVDEAFLLGVGFTPAAPSVLGDVEAGPTGPQGAVGPIGPMGATGPAGAASTVPGPIGPTGATGPMPPASTINPVMNGTAAPGVGTNYSREDHVHPRDTGVLGLTGGAITGNLSITGITTVLGSNSLVLNSVPAGGQRSILAQSNGSNRWQLVLADGTAESGSNAGSNFALNALGDTGSPLSTPLSIDRATGVCTFSAAIVNGPSDRSSKENIAPLEGSLDKVLALQGVSFNMISDADKRRQIGLIAQDVVPVVPEIIQQFRSADDNVEIRKLALDYPKLTVLLIEALKEAVVRIAVLEDRLP
jgi:hypothetical protein